MKNRTLITAHSGCENTQPNSMSYLRMAVQLPCDVIEIDIRKKGNTLWLSHDVITHTKNLLKLTDALTFLNNYDKKINCDLKEEIFPEVLSCVREMGMLQQVLFTGSVTLKDIQNYRDYTKHIFLNIENIYPHSTIPTTDIEHIIQECVTFGVGGINIKFDLVNKAFVKIADLSDIKIAVWTVDKQEDLNNMAQLELYSITTYRVLTLHRILEELHE